MAIPIIMYDHENNDKTLIKTSIFIQKMQWLGMQIEKKTKGSQNM